MIIEETKRQDRSASTSTASASAANPIPIRQPTAFAAPAPNPATSSGPTFYKTPVHAAVSADGTSVFCVEGYVNTPELSAGRGGGLSQGLPANGPYKSLFRARSESRGSNKTASAATATATAIAPDAALHVLAEAASSPEALSPVSAASPAPAPAPGTGTGTGTGHVPVPTAKKRRRPSPLVAASSPASSVAPMDSISAVATQPSPSPAAASAHASPASHAAMDRSPPPPPPPPPRPPSLSLSHARPRGGGTGKDKHREKAPALAAAAAAPRRSSAQAAAGGSDGTRYERRPRLPVLRQPPGPPPFPVAEPRETDAAVHARPRTVPKTRASSEEEEEVSSVPPAPANDGGYDRAGGYYPSYYEAGLRDAGNTAAHAVCDGGQSPSPPPPKTWESSRPSPPVVNLNHYSASGLTTSEEPSPAFMADSGSRPLTAGAKPRMLTLLIEDRRNGTDELAEIHVPLKNAGEALWADARDVCAALQSGPSRIDGGGFCARFANVKNGLTDLRYVLRSCQAVHDARQVSADLPAYIRRW